MKVCIIVMLLTYLVKNANSWWFVNVHSKTCRGRGGSPVYFGRTNLDCLNGNEKKGKRSPSRNVWELSHRWVEYKDYYFERVNYDSYRKGHPLAYTRCGTRREGSPAGYSRLSVDCIKKCTQKYEAKFGKYNNVLNNCHHFANRIVDVLCSSRSCPSWCL